MSDIFHEVEEEVRRENLQKIWKQYGDYIIAAVIVLLLAVAGFEYWTRHEQNRKEQASVAFQNAHAAADKNDLKGAVSQFDKLTQDAPAGYAELAALSKANALAASGKTADAVAAYKGFADTYKDTLADAARVRAAWLMADTAKVTELEALLQPVTAKADGFGPEAREVIAYGYYKNGNMKEAQKRFEALGQDSNATQSVATRAAAMANFIKSGGNNNYGAVPPVAPTKPQAPDEAPAP